MVCLTVWKMWISQWNIDCGIVEECLHRVVINVCEKKTKKGKNSSWDWVCKLVSVCLPLLVFRSFSLGHFCPLPAFESRSRLDFSGSSHTSDLKIGTPVATLPGAWLCRVSAETGWPGVSMLWLGEMKSLICNFCLSVAARKIVWADPSRRYTSMLLIWRPSCGVRQKTSTGRLDLLHQPDWRSDLHGRRSLKKKKNLGR